MTAFLRHNRRAVGWVLTLAMLALATSAGASWQCFRGGPCPMGMQMAARPAASRPAAAQSARPTHACCAGSKAACMAHPARGSATVLDRGSCCTLRAEQTPDTRTQAAPSYQAAQPAAVVPATVSYPVPSVDAPAPALPAGTFLRDACRTLTAPRAPPTCS